MKRLRTHAIRMLAAAGCAGILLVLLLYAAPHSAKAQNGGESEIQHGLAVAPVPLNLDGKNLALVARGSYLVNSTTDCNACHTHPPFLSGGNPFIGQDEKINQAAYLAGGRHFVADSSGLKYTQGDVVSRNLTPDQNGLPAGLTLDQFIQVIRTGVDPDQLQPQYGPLLQVMPWPTFRKMTDLDLAAIYEYLRSIPSAG